MSGKDLVSHAEALIVWLAVSWLLNISLPQLWIPIWPSMIASSMLTLYLVYRFEKGNTRSFWIAYSLTLMTSVICIFLVAYELFWYGGWGYPPWELILFGSLSFGILLPLYFIYALGVRLSFLHEIALVIILNAASYLALRLILVRASEIQGSQISNR